MKRKWNGWQAAGLLILAFFILFVIFPLALILYKSVVDGEGANIFRNFLRKSITGLPYGTA